MMSDIKDITVITDNSIRLTTYFLNCVCLDLKLVLDCLLILKFKWIADKYANKVLHKKLLECGDNA